MGALTQQCLGKQLSNLAEMKEAGTMLFGDGRMCIQDAALMRYAMQYAADLGLTICQSPNHAGLSEGAHVHEGMVSTRLGLRA